MPLATDGDISGHVQNASSTALQGICVSATPASGGGPGGFATADADGNYDIGGLASGSYKVQFSSCGGSDSYLTQWYEGRADFSSADTVSVTAPKTTSGIDATLQEGGHVTGHVQNASSAALQGTCVSATPASGSGFGSNALTDASGNYDIGGLASGLYTVEFSSCGPTGRYITQWYDGKADMSSADAVSVTAPNTTSGIDATLRQGGHITGHVQNTSSNPLVFICVSATPTAGGGLGGSATTDASGDYDIAGLATDSYKVQFNTCGAPGGYVTQWYEGKADFSSADPVSVTAPNTASGIDATLQNGGHITGHVQNTSSTALQGICVSATPGSGGGAGFATTDASGNYDIAGLLSGSYKIQFYSCGSTGGYITQWYNDKADGSTADAVPVTAPNSTSGIDATLQSGGHVTGHVQNASSSPLVFICVTATPTAGGGPGSFATTDASGNCDIAGLVSGSYKVQFNACGAPGGYITQWYDGKADASSADAVSLTAPNTTSGIDATLQIGGHITGHVQNTSSAALQEICVSATPASGSGFGSNALTDAGGNYDIAGLASGSYKVQFYSCGAPGGYGTQWYNGKVGISSADPV
ncbi:MAG: carboxypeptidase regulatory-like domain-containing protein [Solirubrobacteraceae bacterium]